MGNEKEESDIPEECAKEEEEFKIGGDLLYGDYEDHQIERIVYNQK